MSDFVLPKNTPNDVVAAIEKIAPYTDKCVQTFFKIKDKSGKIVDFEYNRPQRLAAERSQKFNFILKARKVGMSSRRIARSLWLCATRKYQHRILLTHGGDAAEKMMSERVIPMIENCQFPLGAKPKLSENYIYFPHTNSRYYIGTAGARKFGRGDDVTGYDFSEFAHWEKPDVQTGVEEACIEGADGDIETTANGHNFAKVQWDAAKLGNSRYRAIFLPWYTNEEYQTPNVDLGILSEEENKLVEAFQLTPAQLAWRRWKISDMSDPALFPQEYPATDEEAFLTSGRLVFDWVSLLKHKGMCAEPKFVCDLRDRGDRIEIVPNPHGKLKIWKVPEHSHVYAVGADVAEGLDGGAYSTGEVIDLGDSEQVAEWHGHIDPTLFGDVLFILGHYYNWAHLVPESWPGPGGITSVRLQELKYPKIWKSIDSERDGWETTGKSKPLMIAELNAALREMRTTIRSSALLSEIQGYVYDQKGLMGPSIGAFSDRLMGYGIGWYATRDIASRIDYYRAVKPDLGHLLVGGGTSVPRREGPMPGRRRE